MSEAERQARLIGDDTDPADLDDWLNGRAEPADLVSALPPAFGSGSGRAARSPESGRVRRSVHGSIPRACHRMIRVTTIEWPCFTRPRQAQATSTSPRTCEALADRKEREMKPVAKLAMLALPMLLAGAPSANAQITPPDFSMMLATNQELAAGACLAGRCGPPNHVTVRSGNAAQAKSPTIVGRSVSPGARQPAFGYLASSAVRQRVIADLISRVRAKDPQGAKEIGSAFTRYDYDRLYDGIAGPYGLSGNDAGSAMTAYLVLGWLIANGQQDVPGGRATALAARAQVASMLAESGAVSRDHWAELGEELKLQFVIAHAGWLNSMRVRSGQPYADGIARQFQQIYGIDLRHTSLDPRGLQPRG